MIPSRVVLSKASRLPMTPKMGNKDYYKGTRQAYLPGGHRTGAPGKHIVRGKGQYRLIDEQVRLFVAPHISDINASPLKPYVHSATPIRKVRKALFGPLPRGGLDAQHYLKIAQAAETPAVGFEEEDEWVSEVPEVPPPKST